MCVQNLARMTRSPIHVEGDSNPMEVIEPIALEMNDSRATFKPTQISNAEVKVNRERISQHQLMAESEEDFDPAELKLLPVLASERTKNSLRRENKKL